MAKVLQAAAIAANRFGYGARPGDLAAIKDDPRGWLKSQLDRDVPEPAPLDDLPPGGADFIAFSVWLRAYRARVQQGVEPKGPGTSLLARHLNAIRVRYAQAVQTDSPFRERLVHFWSNHFVVSGATGSAIAMPPSFEREVARPHVCGRFGDMLSASSKHPAMLYYLDNYLSIGPNSRWGRRPSSAPKLPSVLGKLRGINENLAREILELHTVSVNGGYTQDDVIAFAKVLTGWGIDLGRWLNGDLREAAPRQARDLFYFNPRAHEPGPATIMGETYDQPDEAQGEAVLKRLAVHPKTAQFIATKLARHFVADTPPEPLIERLARRFLDTEGDLRAVAVTLVDSDEAWSPDRQKYKRPEEFAVSTVRALGGPVMEGGHWQTLLESMGQPPYKQPGPDGWSDLSADWTGPDALWKRIEWALMAAKRAVGAGVEPLAFAEAVLGPDVGANTKSAVRSAETPQEAVALVLSSPEFLRR